MSRTKGQNVINRVTVSDANLPFAAAALATVSAPGFDAIRDKGKVLDAADADRTAAKSELDAANAKYLAADQRFRIGEAILTAAAFGKSAELDTWREHTKDVPPAPPVKASKAK